MARRRGRLRLARSRCCDCGFGRHNRLSRFRRRCGRRAGYGRYACRNRWLRGSGCCHGRFRCGCRNWRRHGRHTWRDRGHRFRWSRRCDGGFWGPGSIRDPQGSRRRTGRWFGHARRPDSFRGTHGSGRGTGRGRAPAYGTWRVRSLRLCTSGCGSRRRRPDRCSGAWPGRSGYCLWGRRSWSCGFGSSGDLI